MPGGRIDIEVAPDLRQFPAQLESGMRGAMGVATKVGGLLGVAVGATAATQAVLDIGNSFTNELNTLQAVSSATAEQMQKVRDAAQGLGNDSSLADASATDAAAAMTELAKGGFSVEQSMAAARGTLELAAAAQIGAADAATIQSKALQAFGLDASYAATAADVLANGANASSAEITEIAMGLQQAGAVANQFGVSLEDTVSGLGLLANAGIAGSDAGTLLKSALLALTDQGKPAQQAIEELGLSIYTAEGQFVGFRSLFEQLQEASASMTPEMYQAATATLFGSDAMRLAGVAAEQGVTGWDAMRDAIDREGAAADVAAARTQGLPGAMSAAQNAAEGLALEIYDLADGPLESLITKGADFITDFTPTIVSGLQSAGEAIEPVIGFAGDLAGAFADLPVPVQATAAAFAGMKAFGIDETFVSWIDQAREAFAGFGDEMELQRSLAAASASEYDGLGEAINENAEPLSEWAAGLAAVEARVPAVRQMGDAYRNVSGRAREIADRQREAAAESGRLVGAFRNAGAAAVTFGGQVGGVAAAGARGLGTAAMGAVNALGGPWMVGIAAAGMAISSLIGNIQQARQLSEQYDEALQRVAQSQSDTFSTLVANKGVIDDTVFGQLTEQVNGVSEAFATAGENDAKWNNVFSDVVGDIIKFGDSTDDISFKMDEVALANRRAQEAIESTGLSAAQVAQKVGGSQAEWNTFRQQLIDSGEGGQLAADKLDGLRKTLLDQQEAARRVTPGAHELAEAFALMADEAANADAKSSSLKRALDALAGVPPDLQEATAAYNEVVRETAEATQEAWDRSKGWGAALVGANGEVNSSTENGAALYKQLLAIRDATADAAAAGVDMGPKLAQNREQFAQLATAVGLSAGEIETMARMLGYHEGAFTISAKLAGADGVTAELGVIKTSLDALAPGEPKVVEVDALTDDARARLEELGFKVEKITENGVTTFRVEAETSLAQSGLDAVLARLLEVGGVEAVPKIDADATRFIATNDDVLAKLREIDTTQVDPAVGAVIDDFLAGRDVTLAELSKIDESKVDPEVLLLIQQALRDAQVVSDAIDKAARERNATITVNIREVRNAAAAYGSWSPEAMGAAGLSLSPEEYNRRMGRADGGRLPGFLGGGRMPTTGPGTERTDGIFAVDPSGTPIAMVDGGEWVVNSEMSDKYDREIAMMNAGTFPKLPGFETGGRIAVNRATSYLSGEDGKEYQYGGVGSPSWDCSGYVSAGYAMLTGRDPNTRWFTTESDFNALGFEDGPGPRSSLNIGVMRGGGGMYSHMAATLDGIPFESGGAGVVFGHSTLGADDPNLPLKWHLPVSAFVPPGDDSSAGGGYERRRPRNRETWDEQDELKLDSARIAVQQAIESRDKAMNDPKKSQADKDQAENKVAQAEAKVRELEEKKRAAESGASISPEAPELLTNLTDEELRLRSLERAVDEARWDRNDVWADPESTKFERDEADDKLQTAINALREEQVEQRDELAPAAPALRGRMTDDQIRLVELEQAVKEAEKDRNAVYADPRSTDDERLAADLDLQKALNARDEGRKGGSGSGSGVKSLGAVGLELAEVFAGGVLETFGLEDSPLGFVPKLLFGSGDIGGPLLEGLGTTGIPAMIAQQQVGPAVAPTFSDAEIATQGPVVPGSPGWLEELVNSLRIPAVLRDAGGPLPHGMAGLNLSGETEWVQTAEDKRRYDRDMRELAALRAGASGASGAALEQLGQRQESLLKSLGQLAARRGHTINAYGMDPDKVGRQIEQVLRRDSLAQMSMGGLPG